MGAHYEFSFVSITEDCRWKIFLWLKVIFCLQKLWQSELLDE